jgi:decaprenyl-phosphate phosphoribosyltransferase
MNKSLIWACRPRQWTKNALVFAAPLFSFSPEPQIWLKALGAFVAFCLVSSAVYLLNDTLDLAADRAHPSKRNRPIAAGLVSVPVALIAALALSILSFLLAALCAPALFGLLLLYVLIQVAYCLRLKKEPLLDLLCIASGFLLRATSGGVAASLPLSPWFVLTVGLLALFLAIEKRKAELRLAQDYGVIARAVLGRYSLPLLLRLESTVATSAFMSYSLWASGPALRGAPTSWMLLTVPFVLVGMFRYQFLSDPEEAERRREISPDHTTEKPEEILLGDRGIKLTLAGWFVTTALIGLISHARLSAVV